MVEIMSDIKEYRSPVTGEMITSRSQHREHLKQHNLQEVGNERKAFEAQVAGERAPDRIKPEDIQRAIYETENRNR